MAGCYVCLCNVSCSSPTGCLVPCNNVFNMLCMYVLLPTGWSCQYVSVSVTLCQLNSTSTPSLCLSGCLVECVTCIYLHLHPMFCYVCYVLLVLIFLFSVSPFWVESCGVMCSVCHVCLVVMLCDVS